MEIMKFLAEKLNKLSQEKRNKVYAYFIAMAGSQLSTLAPLRGISTPFDSACVGDDTHTHAKI